MQRGSSTSHAGVPHLTPHRLVSATDKRSTWNQQFASFNPLNVIIVWQTFPIKDSVCQLVTGAAELGQNYFRVPRAQDTTGLQLNAANVKITSPAYQSGDFKFKKKGASHHKMTLMSR